MSGPEETARAAWGDDAPEWVLILARECAETSQNQVAKEMQRSASLISAVLRNKYPGDLTAVEQLVKGRFMNAAVGCPALGSIPTHECLDWRGKARTFVNVNAMRVKMFRACRACPRYLKGE